MAQKDTTPAEGQAQSVTLTVDALKELFKESMTAVVQEIKKPSVLEEKRLADERLQRQKQARFKIRGAQAEEQERARLQGSCPHVKGDKVTSAFAGQVNQDGYIRFVCLRCGLVAPEVKAPVEWERTGVNAADRDGPLNRLTLQQIQAWHDADQKAGRGKPKVKPIGAEPLPPEWEAKIQAMP